MHTPSLRVRSLAFTRGLLVTLMLVLGLAALWVARPLTISAAALGPTAHLNSGPIPFSAGHHLHGSYKIPSQYMLAPGETLTYTIRLHNSGLTTTIANVTDPVPAELDYVAGSASAGGVYDPDTRMLAWDNVTVPPWTSVSLSFAATPAVSVTTPTLVTNTATIATDGETLERRAWIVLVPRPITGPNLTGSYKSASQHRVASGETLTYTIRLHNCGPIMATATVTDPVPVEMNYVAGSASDGGAYDAGTRTVSWSNMLVPAGDSRSLSFVVTATTVESSTLVVNRATIAADGRSFERWATVLLMPEPTSHDTIPPVVHGLTIDEQDVLTEPGVTLHISATDNVSVTRMYLREWQWTMGPFPHWRTVKSSGWVPYQDDYPWTLGTQSGTHYVGVWVADSAFHLSHLDRQALDYASLLVPGETVPKGRIVPYQVTYGENVSVTAVLTPTAGDADLYVWYPGNWFGPDQWSTQPYTATDRIHFVTARPGTYLFVVHGYTAATYDFSITPGGGPRAWGVSGAYSRGAGQVTASETLLDKPPIEDLILSELFASGLDPLGSPAAIGPFEVYLPAIVRGAP